MGAVLAAAVSVVMVVRMCVHDARLNSIPYGGI
jgi:hypothetical protein